MVIGRNAYVAQMRDLLKLRKSYFMVMGGRRRVGKTYLIDHVYEKHMCFRVTGIQNGDMQTHLTNFSQKLAEYSKIPIVTIPQNWQQAYFLLKQYLMTLPKNKKQVIFIDELPWMSTPKSGFIQLLAHLWNDYLSKHRHFLLVICGSSTSWISKRILNDKGGFHNRVTHYIQLKPFTLVETRQFFEAKKIKLSKQAILEVYMILGGIPLYLDYIKKGESPAVAIDRLCFSEMGLLNGEYHNLYKALFESASNHEAIVKSLATSPNGLTRAEIIKKSKVSAGGPYTRAMQDLTMSGFVAEQTPFDKKKRGAIYKLVDEYSIFYHRFIQPNKKGGAGTWLLLSTSQKFKVWSGYAFESICFKHVDQLKKALGISKVYTQTSSLRFKGTKYQKGFQIDLLIDRNDKSINLCECKYRSGAFVVDKKTAQHWEERKAIFRTTVNTNKLILTTLITNQPVLKNEYSAEAVDAYIDITKLF